MVSVLSAWGGEGLADNPAVGKVKWNPIRYGLALPLLV